MLNASRVEQLKVVAERVAKSVPWLGKGNPSKTDEFSEKFQTAVDPPPSFSENHVADFL